MNKIYALFFAFSLPLMINWGTSLQAQQPQHCATDLLFEQMHSTPEGQRALAEYNHEIRHWMAENSGRGTSTATYIIPTVVHIIQETATDELTDACIQDQIRILNEDFTATNADTANVPAAFKPLIGNCDVEFCLATKDPMGNPSTGIIRVVDPSNANHNMSQSSQMKALSQWPPDRYLNIWIPKTISGGILGYATFPTSLTGNPDEDGVVINGEYVGSGACANAPFDLGRTATHEVGHWLGLYHTFQGGCSGTTSGDCATSGDEVCDTPPTASSNFGCPSGLPNTCTETPSDMPDNTHNFMDYGDDNCIIMFTQGQVDRMQATLNTTRSNLWNQTNLGLAGCGCSAATPCSPNANFTADNIIVCPNQIINFTDLTNGPATAWSWTMNGASPSTSTQQNPAVIYSTPGTYDVTLVATNSLGTSTFSQTAYITVSAPTLPPIIEDFEAATISLDWQVQNPDNSTTWELFTNIGSTGSQCVWMDNWNYSSGGTEDALVSTIIDLSSYGSSEMTFDYSYQRASFTFDTLQIFVSDDCGSTWNLEWEKSGGDLANVGGIGIALPWEPTAASDFTQDTLDLAAYLGSDQVKVKFVNKAGSGNNLYLDNINLSALVGRRDPTQGPLWSMNIVPNPFADDFSIQYELPAKTDLVFNLVDLSGRLIYSTELQNQTPGRHELQLPAEVLQNLKAGFYFLRGSSDLGQLSQKVLRMK